MLETWHLQLFCPCWRLSKLDMHIPPAHLAGFEDFVIGSIWDSSAAALHPNTAYNCLTF